mmetsp:Transcript_1626/g.1795  ORF Transcript_1626/g.1795 Transcript_1626/m.1795 type:complete len:203 (+) Transcript_1626:154-762(+)
MISEISPKSIANLLGVLPQLMVLVGIMTSVSMGFFVPYIEDHDSKTSQVWKWIFIMPAYLPIIQLTLFASVFKYDTPIYYEINNDTLSHENSMRRLYKNYSLMKKVSNLLGEDVKEENKSREITWSELFKTPNLKPLISCLMIGLIHQSTGISSVTFFSNEIFSKGYTGTQAELAARIGTFCTGIAGLLAVFTAMILSQIMT